MRVDGWRVRLRFVQGWFEEAPQVCVCTWGGVPAPRRSFAPFEPHRGHLFRYGIAGFTLMTSSLSSVDMADPKMVRRVNKREIGDM